ncbi:MAG: hypothetical protein IT430_00165 [Phycisphaerales bacterium]|nr:hypothetical protein [Phycisphaerales bacterium]
MIRQRAIQFVLVAVASGGLWGCQVELSRRDHWADKAKQFNELSEGKARPADAHAPELRIEHTDGTVTLNCYLPEHLVLHLRNCLAMAEVDLIFEQLVSKAAKQVYIDAQRDPHEAVDWLITNQRDVIMMLNRMTGGLSSPDVTWHSAGDTYRMEIATPVRSTLRFTKLDLIREDGQFKLLLIS